MSEETAPKRIAVIWSSQARSDLRTTDRTTAVQILHGLDAYLVNDRHLRKITPEFVRHYNRGRPHSALGPGISEPSQAKVPASVHRHQLPAGHRIASM